MDEHAIYTDGHFYFTRCPNREGKIEMTTSRPYFCHRCGDSLDELTIKKFTTEMIHLGGPANG